MLYLVGKNILPCIKGCFNASRTTLKEIAFIFRETPETYAFLKDLHFPVLRKLTVGETTLFESHTPLPLAEFITRHPTIEELRFRHDHTETTHHRVDTSGQYVSTLLPGLKVFRGDIDVFLQLVVYKLDCFRNTFRRLETFHYFDPDSEDIFCRTISQIYADEIAKGDIPFPHLVELGLDCSARSDFKQFRELVKGWEELGCRSTLETFLGIPPLIPIDAGVMAHLLASFENLREVHIDMANIRHAPTLSPASTETDDILEPVIAKEGEAPIDSVGTKPNPIEIEIEDAPEPVEDVDRERKREREREREENEQAIQYIGVLARHNRKLESVWLSSYSVADGKEVQNRLQAEIKFAIYRGLGEEESITVSRVPGRFELVE